MLAVEEVSLRVTDAAYWNAENVTHRVDQTPADSTPPPPLPRPLSTLSTPLTLPLPPPLTDGDATKGLLRHIPSWPAVTACGVLPPCNMW